jgi:chromate transporter
LSVDGPTEAALPGSAPGQPTALGALFAGFLKVSLCGFGGGLVWAHRAVVERHRWMDEDEFADTLSLCQFLPGPNIVGIAVCVGAKQRGAVGALAALAGFTLIPWAIGLCVAVLYLDQIHRPVLQNILGGVSAVAAGLLMATGARLLIRRHPHPSAFVFAALAFAGAALAKLPLLVVLAMLAPLSVGAAAVFRRSAP